PAQRTASIVVATTDILAGGGHLLASPARCCVYERRLPRAPARQGPGTSLRRRRCVRALALQRGSGPWPAPAAYPRYQSPGTAAGLGGRYPPRAHVLGPRDCPRGCIWPVPATTAADREPFFGQSDATRIHVIEAGWLERIQACRLYAYQLPTAPFRPHEVGGYWVTDQPVHATGRVLVDDLLGQHARARIELRITPSIWPFWRK